MRARKSRRNAPHSTGRGGGQCLSRARRWKAVAGAILVAVGLYAVLATPGLLSDRDSTVPVRTHEARR